MTDLRRPYAACRSGEETFVLDAANNRVAHCNFGTPDERWAWAERIAAGLNAEADAAARRARIAEVT